MFEEHQRNQHKLGRVSQRVKEIKYDVKSFLGHCKDYVLYFAGVGNLTENFEPRSKGSSFYRIVVILATLMRIIFRNKNRNIEIF